MDEDLEFIRSLIDDSRTIPVKPGGWSLAALNPWAYEPKSQERYEEDQRAAYVLGKLNERYPRAHIREGIPEVLREAAFEHKRDPAYLTSPYQNKGAGVSFIADRSGRTSADYGIPEVAMNTLRWAQSFPTAIYNTGQMVGNEVHKALSDDYADKHVPYPEAYDQFAYNMNTLTGGLTSKRNTPIAGVPTPLDYFANMPADLSYWRDLQDIKAHQDRGAMRASREFVPQSQMEEWRRQVGNAGQAMASEMMPEGDQFLESAGVPEPYARWLGPAMDAFIGVPPTIGSATKLLNAGKPVSALTELVTDYALSTPHLWGPPVVRGIKNSMEGRAPWESSTKRGSR